MTEGDKKRVNECAAVMKYLLSTGMGDYHVDSVVAVYHEAMTDIRASRGLADGD